MADLRALLKTADDARRRAMITGDVETLARILADDLRWTHSSGVVEDKQTVLESIRSGAVSYQELIVADDTITALGTVALHAGTLRGEASRNGQSKSLAARFLAVWRQVDGQPQLLAWQSTNFTT